MPLLKIHTESVDHFFIVRLGFGPDVSPGSTPNGSISTPLPQIQKEVPQTDPEVHYFFSGMHLRLGS